MLFVICVHDNDIGSVSSPASVQPSVSHMGLASAPQTRHCEIMGTLLDERQKGFLAYLVPPPILKKCPSIEAPKVLFFMQPWRYCTSGVVSDSRSSSVFFGLCRPRRQHCRHLVETQGAAPNSFAFYRFEGKKCCQKGLFTRRYMWFSACFNVVAGWASRHATSISNTLGIHEKYYYFLNLFFVELWHLCFYSVCC